MSNALLVYPFGSSDLCRCNAAPFGSVQNAVQCLKATMKEVTCEFGLPAPQRRLVAQAGNAHACWPILGDTLSYLVAEGVSAVTLQPILTEQAPVHENDTKRLLPFLEAISAALSAEQHQIALKLLDPWIIRESPHDQQQMEEVYRGKLYESYVPIAPDFARRYFQLATGTPAMSLAAFAFSQDPGLTFLYTPAAAATQEAPLFTGNRQGQTRQLVDNLLRRMEWGAAAIALEQKGNGFTPLDYCNDPRSHARHPSLGQKGDGSTPLDRSPHPLQNAIDLAHALDAWLRRDLECARELFGRHSGLDAARRMAGICSMSDETEVLKDAAERFRVAWATEDPAAAILTAYTFSDTCLDRALQPLLDDPKEDYSLTQTFLDCVRLQDSRFERKVYAEWARRLAVEAVGNADGQRALPQAYKSFYWMLHKEANRRSLRSLRNDLTHRSVELTGLPELVAAILGLPESIAPPADVLHVLIEDVLNAYGLDGPGVIGATAVLREMIGCDPDSLPKRRASMEEVKPRVRTTVAASYQAPEYRRN